MKKNERKKSTPSKRGRPKTSDDGKTLSEREVDILKKLKEGLQYKQIADVCCISINTVRTHTQSIYGKLEVSNKMEAVNKYYER